MADDSANLANMASVFAVTGVVGFMSNILIQLFFNNKINFGWAIFIGLLFGVILTGWLWNRREDVSYQNPV